MVSLGLVIFCDSKAELLDMVSDAGQVPHKEQNDWLGN